MPSDLTVSLKESWSFDTSPGMLIADRNSNTLTAEGTPSLVSGKVAQALHAESFDHYLFKPHNSGLATGSGAWTICGWARIPSAAADIENILCKFDAAFENSDYELSINITAGAVFQVIAGRRAAAVLITSIAQSAAYTGGWMFCVGQFDPATTTIRAQVNNGTPVSATDANLSWATIADGETDILSFCSVPSEVDQICLWSRVLDSTDLTWLYNSGTGRTYAEILATAASRTGQDLAMLGVG